MITAKTVLLASSAESDIKSRFWRDGFQLRKFVDGRFKLIGSGNYSFVYDSPPNNAIKTAFGDECWHDYMLFVERNKGNKYLPKIRWHAYYKGDAETPLGYPAKFFTITIMERLKPFRGDRALSFDEQLGLTYAINSKKYPGMFASELERLLERALKKKRDDAFTTALLNDKGKHEKSKKLLKEYMENTGHPMHDAVLAMEEMGRKLPHPCQLDMHDENVMMRGKTPVLIDPLYYFRS